jgi:hypothetical protein
MLILCSVYVSDRCMTSAPPTDSSSDPGPCDAARDRGADSARADEAATGRQVRLLEELAVAGMGLARIAGARATVPAGADVTPDIAEQVIIFGHVARAIRQTIGLEVKLRAERRARAPDPAADAATERQLRLLQELAAISLAVARTQADQGAVPIFLKVSRAVRRTVGLAVSLRHGRPAPEKGAAAAPSQPPAEPASGPDAVESPQDPAEELGDIASTLAETLDAFDEYYRFLRVPVAEAVALIFEALGVPVETGRGPARGAEPDPVHASAAAAPTGEEAGFDSDQERMIFLLDYMLCQTPAGGNRGPP